MPMSYDEYDTKRSWLVDTAETPEDKKRLKAQLQKLRAERRHQTYHVQETRISVNEE